MLARLPGLDLEALTCWLDDAHPGLRDGGLRAEAIVGGKSNLTYLVTDRRNRWALRRPPLAHLLPTAHDMAREYRVISALSRTDVPVPEAVALCSDPGVLGAPFYLMNFVDGVVLDDKRTVAAFDPVRARRIGEELVDTLVALHAVDPAAVGLDDFGHPDGFLDRQLRRWHAQWEASETRELPVLAEVVDALREARPVSPSPTVVHGDYRLTNVIVGADLDRIAAVVDWEMATVGDPLTDVGLLTVYHQLATDSDFTMPRMHPRDGFLAPAELVERYARHSGRDVSQLDWYVAFGFFKLAVVAEGIAARHLQGKTVGAGFERFGAAVPGLLEQARGILHG
ncbi:MAG: phosphotransferase family protein [Actinomycetota bacterium]